MNEVPLTSSELDRFVLASGESSYIDAKGPVAWDGNVKSAGLAKDIAAFANSRDGGVLVIGKSENGNGDFELTGLTAEQASSFETTKVAKWVNSRFAPPIDVVCHQHEHCDKRFVVITVAGFSDIPVLCTKSFQSPDNPNNHLIRERTIYVRNASAESAPLGSVDELRALIGLATLRRGNEMLAMFESMLKGKTLLDEPTEADEFETERREIEQAIGSDFESQIDAGAWQLVVHPTIYEEERWKTAEELERVIRERAIRIGSEFPGSQVGTHMREWGLYNDAYHETWTLARSGQFISVRPYWENEREYTRNWISSDLAPKFGPGQWLDFKPNIKSIVELFMFSARLAEEFAPGSSVRVWIRATGLNGRSLATTDFKINLPHGEPCRAHRFEVDHTVSVEQLRGEWEDLCADAMKRFIDLFPGPNVAKETMSGWIEQFKSRGF